MRRILIFVILLLAISCNLVFAENQEVKLNSWLHNALNQFFTYFSEEFLEPFEKGKPNNKDMIEFGIRYNNTHQSRLIIGNGNMGKLSEKHVEATVEKFFGVKIKKHESPSDYYKYKNGYYYFSFSSGEYYRFSKVTRLVCVGKDTFVAYINIYAAGSGWVDDINKSEEEWKKNESNSGGVPELEAKMKATIRKIGDIWKSKYILIEYLRVK